MPDVLPAVAAEGLPGGPAAAPSRTPTIAVAVPVWDRLDGCNSAARGLVRILRQLGAYAEVWRTGPSSRPGAIPVPDRRVDLVLATLDTLPAVCSRGRRLAVWLHGPGTWRWTEGLRHLVGLWLVPSLAYPWAEECPGWPPPGTLLELQPGFDPEAWPAAGPEGRSGVLAVDCSQGKGGQVVLDVARALPGVQFTVVTGGGPSPHPGLWEQRNVRVLPQQEDMGRLYRGAAALLHPSPSETWGLVLAEAQASGCPVVCGDTPVTRRTMGCGGHEEDAAVLVRPGSPAASWAEEVWMLAEAGTPWWCSLQERGISAARRWSDRACFRRLVEEARGGQSQAEADHAAAAAT